MSRQTARGLKRCFFGVVGLPQSCPARLQLRNRNQSLGQGKSVNNVGCPAWIASVLSFRSWAPTWELSETSAQRVCPLPVHCPALGAEDDGPVRCPAALVEDSPNLEAVNPERARISKHSLCCLVSASFLRPSGRKDNHFPLWPAPANVSVHIVRHRLPLLSSVEAMTSCSYQLPSLL